MGIGSLVRCIVAVSGGVDSVVLLDVLARAKGYELIIAHFDHGIREDSASDRRFVEALAKKYNLQFVSIREELGSEASEEVARNRRYAFLRKVAADNNATIVTAHHADDIIETIAINAHRGTGWRGLAVLNAADVFRPLIRYTKQDIYSYALTHRLEWVEDSTNSSDRYLRNRFRRRIAGAMSSENKKAIRELHERQLILKAAINTEIKSFINDKGEYSRYLFTVLEPKIAIELLRVAIYNASGVSPTRPQAERALIAIKTARTNTRYQTGEGVNLQFTVRRFIVETP